ncbi:gas vesicle protein GvpO, halophile-type [Natronorubrum daqingense]|uniref:Gas vesicle protein n=1 Tax=Natronorubrum daqingense TaxID=588898 RepID=A0A1N7E965_9EURY|nr:gas vesicle protein [Natronorubrum daqingense]APX96429.1 gas vesicle protein [Natronorubrum daqingense]SIR84548.1 Gas vesicle synthesis protein GvpO [Natronorubrum daqingense]
MAEADTEQSTDQCKALTADGERCSRPAREDGFCYQHNESDQTVSDSQSAQSEQDEQESDSADEQQSESETEEESRSHSLGSVEMSDEEKTDPDEVDVDVETEHDQIAGVLGVRQSVQSSAGELIGREFDAVSEIVPTDDGWRAVVEVIERRSVPDTQDIIGRYEIELTEDAVVHGYRRLDRYRRGDTAAFE